jgi:glutamine amidotransferase
MTKTIGVIDAGIGNVMSIARALKDVGATVNIIKSSADIKLQTGLVLPGVGAFDHGVELLQSTGLWDGINDFVANNSNQLLGICLGMQLLAEGSEEGRSAGLGLIPGYVCHLSEISGLPDHINIPNMGWGFVKSSQSAEKKWPEYFTEKQRFYFVHSYYFKVSCPDYQFLHLSGMPPLSAAVRANNVCGFQFHPEKSHRFGRKALQWWVEEIVGC